MTHKELEDLVIEQGKAIIALVGALEAQVKTHNAIIEAVQIIANHVGLPQKPIDAKETRH